MGVEQKLDSSQMSEKDREMMGLGTRLETEKPDDELEDWRNKPLGEPAGPQQGLTGKGRFGNLEMMPPGLRGEELERWKREQEQMVQDADARRKDKERQEELNEPHSSKYF